MTLRDELQSVGKIWLRQAFSQEEVDTIAKECAVGERPGARLSPTPPLAKILGRRSKLARLIQTLGFDQTPVRLVAFNKSAEANWSVPWHQDRVIAVAEKVDVAGYGNWLNKNGFWHCEAPARLLARMMFARVHLDACEEKNGALELALGTHRRGFIRSDEAAGIADDSIVEICDADVGDVLIANALILHRSRSAAAVARERRALRIDFAVRNELADQLRWAIDPRDWN